MSKQQVEEPEVVTEEKVTRWEEKFEENKKSYTLIGGIIVVVILLYVGWVKFYLGPQEIEAREQMLYAEKFFEQDSLDLAMDGTTDYLGFQGIIDNYGFTKAANLAHYYMGISLLRQGYYEDAIDYLSDFDADDEMLAPIATGALGDAYAELGENEKAIEHYLDAAEKKDNNFTSPIYYLRAGILLEEMGKPNRALEAYEAIQRNYKETNEGREIEKYIARVKTILESN